MIPILVAQLALPLLLVLWMAIWPPRSTTGWIAQTVGSLLVLVTMAPVGIWVFPPWWTPYLAATALLVIAVRSLRRPLALGRWPRGVGGWMHATLFAIAGVFSFGLLLRARAAERLPDNTAIIDLAFPFESGTYLVVNGGNDPLRNAHQASLDTTITRLRAWRGNAHAVDLVAINALGFRAPGFLPPDPASYAIFGRPVLAPCSGEVVRAVDGVLDNRVPQWNRANMAGNHVFLACDGVHVVLAHFRQGSVRVRPGEYVEIGDVLGEVGNSGGSDEPHLHVHAQRPGPEGAPFAGDPVPVRLGGRYLARGDRIEGRPIDR